MKTRALSALGACLVAFSSAVRAADDIVLTDFEGQDYGAWKVEGAAFGTAPARGTLPGQMAVDGFAGRGLANSFVGGDGATGTLTSPEFKIERRYLAFLIGGGGWPGQTCLNLLVDGKVARTATGPNVKPGGSERLEPQYWDVAELAGRTAQLQIVDAATGGWGHVNVDQIVQSDRKPPMTLINAQRELTAQRRLLHFPVQRGAPKRSVTVLVDGHAERFFEIELADAPPVAPAGWWAPLDIAPWRGRKLVVQVDKLPDASHALDLLEQGDELKGAENLYREALRPQLHFSAQRGWLNDPNGLAFYNGECHLFFQHDPYTWDGAAKHWGHAVSRDLVHWRELDEALSPDALGAMWSGSGVVDGKNTSGLGQAGKPPLVLIYTAAGGQFTQGIASSTDGRSFAKYAGNPVLRQITGGNRDPKVTWHEPTQRWVMTLYVEKDRRHTVHFLTSPNLREWTLASVAEGGAGNDNLLYECPDFFELPVDGDPNNKKWLLTAANSEYLLGRFDGTKFTPETPKQPGHSGRGFYAPQTFSDIPAADGRRIQIGWLMAATPGMPFNQALSLPHELTLRTTPDGVRLARQPVRELASLRAKPHQLGPLTLRPGDADPLANIRGELLEVRAEFAPGQASEVRFTVRGVPVVYDAKKQEIIVHGHHAAAPLQGGRQRLIIYADRTAYEVFASDGLTYVPLPVTPDAKNQAVELAVTGGAVQFATLEVHELKSIWQETLKSNHETP